MFSPYLQTLNFDLHPGTYNVARFYLTYNLDPDFDFVLVHGRYSGSGLPANWVVADIIRMKDGILVEQWDVIQDEATREQSKSGNPMFGVTFPEPHAK